MVILIDICFRGIKCFQNQPQLVSVLQHGKNLACYPFLPKRETEMLAKALNILASTANRFHLFLAASKLTSDVGKKKKSIGGKRHRGGGGGCCSYFFPLRQTKHAYNYVKHNFFFSIILINPRKLSNCSLPSHKSIKYQANIIV